MKRALFEVNFYVRYNLYPVECETRQQYKYHYIVGKHDSSNALPFEHRQELNAPLE